MIKKLAHHTGALFLAGGLAAPAIAADHREAPLIEEDITADIADIYAFLSPNNPDKLVLAMTVNPFSVAGEAGSYNFSADVRYRFNIDTTGDAVAEHTIDFAFSPIVPEPQTFVATFPDGIVVEGEASPPVEEVEGEMPDEPIIVDGPAGIRIYAGPRDDPFFFDFPRLKRVLESCRAGACDDGLFRPIDTFAGFNVSAIVVEVPVELISNGAADLQIWGETTRPRVAIRRTPVGNRRQRNLQQFQTVGSFQQIERMGNPVISTVLVPKALKDAPVRFISHWRRGLGYHPRQKRPASFPRREARGRQEPVLRAVLFDGPAARRLPLGPSTNAGLAQEIYSRGGL